MNEIEKFNKKKKQNTKKQKNKLKLGFNFVNKTVDTQYTYNFSWLGRPIIQFPQDMIATQELIWKTKPDLIIETGIAHGGSLIFSASILMMLETCGLIKKGKVLGIDIDIRNHNKKLIKSHPMYKKITMFEGSSTSSRMADKVKKFASRSKNIMLILDSNHTHDHVFNELELYGSLVSKNNYCIVFDTIIEYMPKNSFPNRPWDKGNNPKTAVDKYLRHHPEFIVDRDIDNQLLITNAPNGYLKKIK